MYDTDNPKNVNYKLVTIKVHYQIGRCVGKLFFTAYASWASFHAFVAVCCCFSSKVAFQNILLETL